MAYVLAQSTCGSAKLIRRQFGWWHLDCNTTAANRGIACRKILYSTRKHCCVFFIPNKSRYPFGKRTKKAHLHYDWKHAGEAISIDCWRANTSYIACSNWSDNSLPLGASGHLVINKKLAVENRTIISALLYLYSSNEVIITQKVIFVLRRVGWRFGEFDSQPFGWSFSGCSFW